MVYSNGDLQRLEHFYFLLSSLQNEARNVLHNQRRSKRMKVVYENMRFYSLILFFRLVISQCQTNVEKHNSF